MGASLIYEKVKEYMEKNYRDAEEWRISLCILEDAGYYKVNVEFCRRGDPFVKTAMIKADASTGDIIEFREGWQWKA